MPTPTVPAPIVHFEIGFRDIEKAKAFYGPLLGWNFQAYGPAAMVMTDKANSQVPNIGGHLNSLGHEPHNYTVVYAMVENLEASIEKARTLGGKLTVPPTAVPGMGRFAWIQDPEGNIFGLWTVAM